MDNSEAAKGLKMRRKRLVILFIIIGALLCAAAGYFIYWQIGYSKYTKPFLNNERLSESTEEGNVCRVFDDENNVSTVYELEKGSFPSFPSTDIVQARINDDHTFDGEYTIQITYRAALDGTVFYELEYGDTKQFSETYSGYEKSFQIRFDENMKMIKMYGNDSSNGKQTQMPQQQIMQELDSRKDRINSTLEKYYAFFGRDNFKKPLSI